LIPKNPRSNSSVSYRRHPACPLGRNQRRLNLIRLRTAATGGGRYAVGCHAFTPKAGKRAGCLSVFRMATRLRRTAMTPGTAHRAVAHRDHFRPRPTATGRGRYVHLALHCLGLCLAVLSAAGCAGVQGPGSSVDRVRLKERSMECLKAAVAYKSNPAVRAAAVEALESSGSDEAMPWLRTALLDEHPGVRFAACVAIGRLGDRSPEITLRGLVDDPDDRVRVAALFALHRLGQTKQSGRLPVFLLKHPDAAVRRNAAFVLGLLDEPGASKVLAKAMRDSDPGVRNHALEAMARLGVPEARQELSFMANAGVGAEETFAVQALAAAEDAGCGDTLRYKLSTAPHLETKLAAAHGLGRLGSDDGFTLALEALRSRRPVREDPADPPEAQVLRVRQMGASALGAIGRSDALSELGRVLEEDDPRLQVSAARAILQILQADRRGGLSFLSSNRKKR